MNADTIRMYDKSDMRALLAGFPAQVAAAVGIGRKARLEGLSAQGLSQIVVTGLGGSAIGGDLLRSYLGDEIGIPFSVNRTYQLPASVGRSTLVIVSSYSGNTEETISAYADAMKRRAKILCITSGGEVAATARKHRHPVITLPGGLPPRAALGYSFFPMLTTLARLKLIGAQDAAVRETIALLKKLAKRYGSPGKSNAALQLARTLYLKLPVIYSSAERFDVVNLRWRGQIAENAKVLAFGHVVPEMNHNELVGWRSLTRLMEEMVVIWLRDRQDHPRVKMRFEIAGGIIEGFAGRAVDVASEGKSLLARTFSLIHLGDWVSFYLAMLGGVDPTPVKVIDYLKARLADR